MKALVTQQQISEIASAVDAENNAASNSLTVDMMVIAMFRLQHVYERARTELRQEIEQCGAERKTMQKRIEALEQGERMLLKRIEELKAK